MKFTVKQAFTRNRIASLLCCAIESGGIKYWCELTKYGKPKNIWKWETNDKEVYRHIQYPLSEGGSITIQDLDSEKNYKLTLGKLRKGLQVMADKYPMHFANFVNKNEDAETGDVFVQCVVFGDVIYG